MQLLEEAGVGPDACVLDVGGGDSHLVDALIARGFGCVSVLDVSSAALARARARLGPQADRPTWITADVTGEWSAPPMDVWHDRAVFHFLTAPADRASYRRHLRETLKPGGTAVIATFAPDGPQTCSGLDVCRYAPEDLASELGTGFTLAASRAHVHTTPWGASQSFQYSRFLRVG